MRKLTLTAFVVLATPFLSGCLAATAVGAAGAVVGTTAKVAVKTTGAVVGAAIPDNDDNKKNKD